MKQICEGYNPRVLMGMSFFISGNWYE